MERGTESRRAHTLTSAHAIAPSLKREMLRDVYGRCRLVQSRLGTGVIRFGRRGEGTHRESRSLARSTAVSSVSRDEVYTGSYRCRVWRVEACWKLRREPSVEPAHSVES
jgi:hypothetical protein